MKPSRHIIAGFSVGLAFTIFTKNLHAGLICFISSVFLDVDHIIDFIIHHGIKSFTIRRVYRACEQTQNRAGQYKYKRLYLFLHVYEIAILLWIVLIYIKNVYLLAFSIGYSLHLIMDAYANQLHPYAYFMAWRILRKFDPNKLYKAKT